MKHEDKKPHDKQVHTQDTGNGNPPPKDPPKTVPLSTDVSIMTGGDGESSEDTGNGNPPPKG